MPTPKKDAVHRYFEFDDSSKTSKCKLCDKSLKGKHTSNLKGHMAVKHSDEYQTMVNINKQSRTSTKNNSAIQKNLDTIKNLCMKLITVHGRPLALIEDEAFQDILNMIVPSSTDARRVNIKAIKDLVTEQASNIKFKIWKEIKGTLFSLKLDSVTCAERKFIGINIQYIKQSNIIVRNLAVIEVHKSQTGEFLKETVEEVLEDFKLSINQIYSVCTDNGSNMIKMVKLIGGKYYISNSEADINENLNEEESEDEEAESDSEIETGESDTNINYDSDNLFYNSYNSSDFKIRGMLCAAHTLQLAVKDAINADVGVQTVVNLSRKVVTILRHPRNTIRIRQDNLNKAIHDCPTRWTSTYNMLVRLITLKDICGSIEEISSMLSDQFWIELKNLIECLKPVNTTTLCLQRKNLTIGDFFISWFTCKNQIESLNYSFSRCLHLAMLAREAKLLENDVVLEAVYLDRRINLILNPQQCEKARDLLKQTYKKIKSLQDLITTEDTSQNEVQPSLLSSGLNAIEEDHVPPTMYSSGLNALEEMLRTAERIRGASRQINSFEACLNNLCSQRISLTENILEYWNNTSVMSSEMAMVAKIVLAAPATQVSVERLFSSLKFILNPLRTNLNQYFLRDIMLVRENKDLL